MNRRARVHHSEAFAKMSTAQAMFDGALRQFDGHAMAAQPHAIEAARRELHDRLDDLLAAKNAFAEAAKRSLF